MQILLSSGHEQLRSLPMRVCSVLLSAPALWTFCTVNCSEFVLTPPPLGYSLIAGPGGTAKSKPVDDGWISINGDGTGAGATDISICPAGNTCSQGIKHSCSSGTYRASTGGGPDSCTQCDTGKISVQTWNAGSGVTACQSCLSGSFRSSSSSCDFCGQAENGNEDAGVAEESSHDSSVGVFCASRLVEPGKYTNTSATERCLLCDRGKAVNYPNATSCSDCAAGRYAGTTGSTQCTQCPTAEFYCPAGADKAYKVEDGYISVGGPVGATSFDVCPVGATCTLGVPTPCPAGYYRAQTGGIPNSCDNCGVGAVSDEGATECNVCTFGRLGQPSMSLTLLRCNDDVQRRSAQLHLICLFSFSLYCAQLQIQCIDMRSVRSVREQRYCSVLLSESFFKLPVCLTDCSLLVICFSVRSRQI
jgi:hypothetical protein